MKITICAALLAASAFGQTPTIAGGGACYGTHGGPLNGGTYTSGVNCTGATLFFAVKSDTANHTCTLTDNENNTWTQGPTYNYDSTLSPSITIEYVYNPKVSSSQQFKLAGTNCQPGLAFVGVTGSFSGTTVYNGGGGTGSGQESLTTGSVTPNSTNEACFSVLGWGNTPATISALAVSDGFKLLDTTQPSAGANYGVALSYLFAPVSGIALDPNWTWNPDAQPAAGLVCFPTTTTAAAENSVTITWAWAQGSQGPANGFRVLRSATTDGPYTVTVCTVEGLTTLTCTDTNVAQNTTYYYVAEAVNSAVSPEMVSGYSNQFAVTVP
jgi:hypothetical protein